MARTSSALALLVAACALTLGACSKQADTSANAPGSPGTGNATEVVRPAMPDSPPGGPSGIAGSTPHPGSSGGESPVGTTGTGTDTASQSVPGQGLDGGLNTSQGAASAPAGGNAAMGASGSGALQGSPNTTSGNAVGQR